MNKEVLKGGAVNPIWFEEMKNPIEASIPVVLSIVLLLTTLFLLASFIKAIRKKRKSSFLYLIIMTVVFATHKQILAIIADIVGAFGQNPLGLLMGIISVSAVAALIRCVFEDIVTWLDKTRKGK